MFSGRRKAVSEANIFPTSYRPRRPFHDIALRVGDVIFLLLEIKTNETYCNRNDGMTMGGHGTVVEIALAFPS